MSVPVVGPALSGLGVVVEWIRDLIGLSDKKKRLASAENALKAKAVNEKIDAQVAEMERLSNGGT